MTVMDTGRGQVSKSRSILRGLVDSYPEIACFSAWIMYTRCLNGPTAARLISDTETGRSARAEAFVLRSRFAGNRRCMHLRLEGARCYTTSTFTKH